MGARILPSGGLAADLGGIVAGGGKVMGGSLVLGGGAATFIVLSETGPFGFVAGSVAAGEAGEIGLSQIHGGGSQFGHSAKQFVRDVSQDVKHVIDYFCGGSSGTWMDDPFDNGLEYQLAGGPHGGHWA